MSYKSEERLITFNLETFCPVTLIQDAHINMPYQSWELRPLDVNKVLLTITTVFTELQIQIKVNRCYSKSYQRVKSLDDYKSVCQNSQSLMIYILKYVFYKYIENIP